MSDRDYKKEYRDYHGKPEQVADRSSRNKARRKLKKEGRVHDGDGKDVDHKDGNPKNNSRGNLRVRDRNHNRADNQKAYVVAASLLKMVQKAGARHSARDMGMVQEMHDRACELGAKCQCQEVMAHPMLRAKHVK